MEYVKPDPSIVKRLKARDKRLGVEFGGKYLYVTYQRATGQPVPIHCVKGNDGGFRQINQKDVEFIFAFDQANESAKERIQKVAQEAEKIRERQRRNAKSEIRDMTKDGKRQLEKAFVQATNLGKGNAAFRRVDLKRKGKTWEEIRNA